MLPPAAKLTEISDLVTTLALTARPSKLIQSIRRFNYVINQSLMKYCPMGSKILC